MVMTQQLDERGCTIAKLDLYCDQLQEQGSLSQGVLEEIRGIFQKYPELQEEFPRLVQLL